MFFGHSHLHWYGIAFAMLALGSVYADKVLGHVAQFYKVPDNKRGITGLILLFAGLAAAVYLSLDKNQHASWWEPFLFAAVFGFTRFLRFAIVRVFMLDTFGR